MTALKQRLLLFHMPTVSTEAVPAVNKGSILYIYIYIEREREREIFRITPGGGG